MNITIDPGLIIMAWCFLVSLIMVLAWALRSVVKALQAAPINMIIVSHKGLDYQTFKDMQEAEKKGGQH